MKRAHLCTVEVLKKMVRAVGLTPARFDVMFVLRNLGGACEQSELWKWLGVSRQTICTMLRGMEEKGLVWREGNDDDTRRRTVYLTKDGLERFLAAAKEIFRTEKLRDRFDAMHQEGRAFVERAAKVVWHVGRALGDTARHAYTVDAPDAQTIEEADKLNAEVAKYVERSEKRRPKKREPHVDALEYDDDDDDDDDDAEPDPDDLTPEEVALFQRTDLNPVQLMVEWEAIVERMKAAREANG